METWKTISGVIIFLIGLVVGWQGYSALQSCNSVTGQVYTFISTILGGGAASACYNANVSQYVGLIVAIIGLVIIYTSYMPMKKGRK
ncbi:MAG: hypothetical protein KGH53_00700 [Candidatus Micrarchaeota archaeon]|nr:hypothetical protein [Candidatus Micrarchaeota archaeon]